jgi:predicted Zn-dependent protease
MPPAGAASAGGAAGATDISRMSTEEMAQRLFDRTMRLSEEGKKDSVAFFGPMALQTYAQLPALDNHSRYDVGMLHLAVGDPRSALAQADTLIAAVPNHLYALVLRARAYEALGDQPRARTAFATFLRHEAAERAGGRPEYAAHASTLDAFKQEALGRAGGS